MNGNEAKRILLAYRPGSRDVEDSLVAEALRLAEREPELRSWLTQHAAFQQSMSAGLRSIQAPESLKRAILSERNIVRPTGWQKQLPAIRLAAAAAVVLLGAVLVLMPRGDGDRVTRFASYRERMVSTAIREYRMDIVTDDMKRVRQYMAESGAPSDYEVTPGLTKLKLTGGGVLRWRNQPVSMVCFDRGDQKMLFLFVIDRTGLKDPPGEAPAFASAFEHTTVSWTRDDKVYVLAGPEEKGFAEKYL